MGKARRREAVGAAGAHTLSVLDGEVARRVVAVRAREDLFAVSAYAEEARVLAVAVARVSSPSGSAVAIG